MYRRRLEEALPRIRERIAEAALRAGRDPSDVRILPVTKGHGYEAIEAVLEAGLADVGENRLEELEWKRARTGSSALRWHMVGRLQRRKAPQARDLADLVHSLDSRRLAERLERTAPDGAEPLPVLAQVNVSGEEAKTGFDPDAFLDDLAFLLELRTIRVDGLMTMAPFTADEKVLRTTFGRLRELQEEAARKFSGYRGRELSMGMSNDFEVAVEEGSTIVRLGTALLGERPE